MSTLYFDQVSVGERHVVVSTVDRNGHDPLVLLFKFVVGALLGVPQKGRFETMVFEADARGRPLTLRQLDVQRTDRPGAAAAQHVVMVEAWRTNLRRTQPRELRA